MKEKMKGIKRNKKRVAIGIVIGFIVIICAGYGFFKYHTSSPYYMNSAYNETNLKDLNGKEHTFDDTEENGVISQNAGVAVDYSDTMKQLMDQQSLFVSELDNMGYLFVYMPTTETDTALSESNTTDETTTSDVTTEETISDTETDSDTTNEYITSDDSDASDSNVFYYMAVYRVPNTYDEEIEENLNMIKEVFNTIEVIGKTDDATYYLATNTDISDLNFSEEDTANIEKLEDDIDQIKNQICIFNVDNNEPTNVGSFESTSSTGDEVTKDIFSQYDITMINFWSTSCEPCKEEMPELEKLSKELPDNVNFLSVCIDGANDTTLTQSILDDLGCSFKVLYPGSDLTSFIQENYQFVPTTIFVDKDGNVIGSAITGVPSGDDVVQSYLDAIQNRLDTLKSE